MGAQDGECHIWETILPQTHDAKSQLALAQPRYFPPTQGRFSPSCHAAAPAKSLFLSLMLFSPRH